VPFVSRRAQLKLSDKETEMLTALSQSRSEPAGRVQRASILLRYCAGDAVSEIARSLGTNRPRVERCVSKALDLGVSQALADLPGRGRRRVMTAEARAWVTALRVDSSLLLPNAARCLMKNVTRPYERDEWQIDEATEHGNKTRSNRGGGGALSSRRPGREERDS
jgi:hypothetical protein